MPKWHGQVREYIGKLLACPNMHDGLKSSWVLSMVAVNQPSVSCSGRHALKGIWRIGRNLADQESLSNKQMHSSQEWPRMIHWHLWVKSVSSSLLNSIRMCQLKLCKTCFTCGHTPQEALFRTTTMRMMNTLTWNGHPTPLTLTLSSMAGICLGEKCIHLNPYPLLLNSWRNCRLRERTFPSSNSETWFSPWAAG